MTEDIVCLDTGVLVSVLVPEEPVALGDAARRNMSTVIERGGIVMPAFAWAEVGSVL